MHSRCHIISNIKLTMTSHSLREKCPYSELFWSAFSRIRTEYGEILRIQSECGKMWTRITPNTDTFYAVILTKKGVLGKKIGAGIYLNSFHEIIMLCPDARKKNGTAEFCYGKRMHT